MSNTALENLAKIGQLKVEPTSALDIERLLDMARKHLDDAKRESNSIEGRFISAYSVGHAAGLAALRWHGYRSENRYLVFIFSRMRIVTKQAVSPIYTGASSY